MLGRPLAWGGRSGCGDREVPKGPRGSEGTQAPSGPCRNLTGVSGSGASKAGQVLARQKARHSEQREQRGQRAERSGLPFLRYIKSDGYRDWQPSLEEQESLLKKKGQLKRCLQKQMEPI